MKYILSADEMRLIDAYTSESIGVTSEVLMERAALACAEEIRASGFDTKKILIVCGAGNNGADGLALARIINRFYDTEVYMTSQYKNLKGLVKKQYDSAARSKVRFKNDGNFEMYTLIVDAIFGTGLSRAPEGLLLDTIRKINASNANVISVDIPSGVDSTTGKVLGDAVKADITVSFAYAKIGQVLYPGAEYCGKLKVRDIGIYIDLCNKIKATAFTYDKKDLSLIPKRKKYSNKGSYGRVLIVAGSEKMSGAALLCSKAAYKSGCGIVEVFTHSACASVIRNALPEAIVGEYKSDSIDYERLYDAIIAASATVIGPGLSKNNDAREILRYVLESSGEKTVIDADALNIISETPDLLPYIKGKIITPHLGEMSRLINKPISEISEDLIGCASNFANRYGCICVLKDSRTIVAAPSEAVFINTAGNSGMAKGGSGDTLAGIIASLMSQGLNQSDAARIGVYLHACAGDAAKSEHGEYAMIASDISEAVGKIMAGL